MIGKHNLGGFHVPTSTPEPLWPTVDSDDSAYEKIVRFMRTAHGYDTVWPYHWEVTPGSLAWRADVVCRKHGLDYYYTFESRDGRSVYIFAKPAHHKNDYRFGVEFA